MKLTPMMAMVVTAGVLGAQIALAVPSVADPTDDPCGLAVSFFCRFVPIAPELDGDVDLTTQVPPADPAAPPPDSLPPGNVCAMGCV
jgi:hypothetical protein